MTDKQIKVLIAAVAVIAVTSIVGGIVILASPPHKACFNRPNYTSCGCR